MDAEFKKMLENAKELSDNFQLELEPFLSILKAIPQGSTELENFKKAYFDYLAKEKHYKEISQYIMKDFLKALGTRKDVCQLILWYLCVLEAVNHSTINILILLLNACRAKTNIIDLGNKRYSKLIKQACLVENLNSPFIPLGTKLDFLKRNGLKEITSIVDYRFRNSIVHFDFSIDRNFIILNGKNIMPSILENTKNMMFLFSAVGICLQKLAKEKTFFVIRFDI